MHLRPSSKTTQIMCDMVTALTRMPTEIIIIILLKCDIKDIFSLAITCKKIHTMIMESREHWLDRLKALRRCCAPYLPTGADVNKMACSELRETVIRSIRQYREFFVEGGWMKESDSPIKQPYRTFHRFDFGWLDPPSSSALLPGGKYLFTRSMSTSAPGMLKDLELWELDHKPKRLWSYHSAVGLEDIDDYSYYVDNDSSSVLLFVSSSIGTDASLEFDLNDLIHEQRLTILIIQLGSTEDDAKGNLNTRIDYVSQFERRLRLPFVMEISLGFAVIVHSDSDHGSTIRVISMGNYKITDLSVPTHDISKIHLYRDHLICCSIHDSFDEERRLRSPNLFVLMLNSLATAKEGENNVTKLDLVHIKDLINLSINPGYDVEQFLNISICDFKWTCEKRDPIITIFAELMEEVIYPTRRFMAVWEVAMEEHKQLIFVRHRQPVCLPTPFFDLMPMKSSPTGVSPRFLLSGEYRRNTAVICENGAYHDGTRVEARMMHYNVGIMDEGELVSYSNGLHGIDIDQYETDDWNDWFDKNSSNYTIFVGSVSGDFIRIDCLEHSYLGY